MRKLICVLVLVLAFGLRAEAANWEYFSHNDDRTCYYDTTSVTPKGNGIIAVEARSDWKQQAIDRFEDKNLSYTRAILEIDCPNKNFRQILSTSYRKNGEISSVTSEVSKWMPIPDRSIIDYLKNRVCR